jgi:UDP-N-acetylmuramyl pentapeptide phosphotransferase/UDP-N-acetylglucosamine-1-phosphate transferase
MIAIYSFILSFAACWLIIKTNSYHAKFSADHELKGAQKFHKAPTPRIAGLAIFTSAWLIALYGSIEHYLWAKFLVKLLVPTSMVFAVGLAEDLIKKVTPIQRLMLVAFACLVGIYAIHIVNTITHTNVMLIDYFLRFEPLSVILTIFILLGATNAFNIIDGYNGLCLITFTTILITCIFIAYSVNYHYLDQSILILIGAVFGVILWNYPSGKIFLGDGGAYFLGFIATLILLELSQHVPDYSPFTSLLIMIYPISETLLSIYRKKFLRGRSPFKPDRLHMHMVVYYRLIRHDHRNRNAAVVIKMLWFIIPQLIAAFMLHKQQLYIILAIFTYITVYFWVYFRIISFRTPKMLPFSVRNKP